MDTSQRQQSYKDAVEKFAAPNGGIRFSDAFGVSNSSQIIGGGLFAFNANFESYTTIDTSDEVAVHCWLRFPPEDELYFTIFIKDVATFRARLHEMASAGTSKPRGGGHKSLVEENDDEEPPGTASPDALSYTDNSKNIKAYLAKDGRLYLRNKGYWGTMPADLSSISKPVPVEKIVFAIWPPAASASRGLLAREFIGYLGGLIGRDRIHELRVWSDADAVSPEMQRMPATIPIAQIEAAVTASGGHYPDGEVRRLHGALNFLPDKHFVILAGLSGSGKTQLAIKYAHAVHGVQGKDASDPFLFVCPVRPEWTDPTGLTGYDDVLSKRYVVPQFLEAVLLATAHRYSPVFVILDEMNLARVEYYLSDVLSAIETQKELRLHFSGVPMEGSAGTTVPAALRLPQNLYIVGTINVDETTNPVSDKVLDRAVVIDMSTIELAGFLEGLGRREPALKEATAACEGHLLAAHTLMASHGLGFGYRVAEEAVRYHAFAAQYLQAPADSTTDDLMVQKVLVKLRGAEKQRRLLTGLQKALTGLPRSQEFLAGLITDLDEFGSFQASR